MIAYQKNVIRVKCILITLLIPFSLIAQKDTVKKQTIEITSAFKPVLRNASKINFSGSQLKADTSRNLRPYSIPAHNLFYSYRPVPLKPLAMVQDSTLYLGSRNFVKAGIGNYSTPYLKFGLGTGDGISNLVNIYGDYISSKGKIKNQDYSQLSLKAAGSYFLNESEIYGSGEVRLDNYYLYGYDHGLYDYKKDDIRQQLQDVIVKVGYRNTSVNQLGINYDPSIEVDLFRVKDKVVENTVVLDVPIEKKLEDHFTIKAAVRGDFTSYQGKNIIPGPLKFNNNLVQISPSVEYMNGRFLIRGSVIPSWDNGKFYLLPDLKFETPIQEKALVFQAGFTGKVFKNTFKNLTEINPYLDNLENRNNTREIELYGGIRTSLGKHFNLNARAGWVEIKNMPFFINDTANGHHGFITSNESNLNDVRIQGDLSYINKNLIITGAVIFNGYSELTDNTNAWHTLPMELKGSLRWKGYKNLLLKSDLYLFSGSHYLQKDGSSRSLNGGADLSMGAEYKINPKFSLWLDLNNILNDKYERWHNYEVYGLNLSGGIIIRF